MRASRIAEFAEDGGFDRHPKLILDYGGMSEFTEARTGLISRIPVIGAGLQRFGDSFDMTRDLAAISFAEMTDDAVKRMPPGAKKQAMIDVQDELTNKLIGRMRSSELGVSAGQQRIESGFLFLAPQYLRATVGVLSDGL